MGTEAIYLLTDSQKKKEQEMQNSSMQGHIGMQVDLNQNDDVIRKARQYLKQFCQFEDFQVSKKMRNIAKKHSIKTELFIYICDLGLRDYDEAISLFPELKEYEKEHVLELIEEV